MTLGKLTILFMIFTASISLPIISTVAQSYNNSDKLYDDPTEYSTEEGFVSDTYIETEDNRIETGIDTKLENEASVDSPSNAAAEVDFDSDLNTSPYNN